MKKKISKVGEFIKYEWEDGVTLMFMPHPQFKNKKNKSEKKKSEKKKDGYEIHLLEQKGILIAPQIIDEHGEAPIELRDIEDETKSK
jgi:hypothetical protein